MSVKLLILGLLMERDRHPYEIRQTIKDRNWHVTFRVRDGSLYYAVDQLRDDGLIEASEIVPVPGENRPDKTIYRITDKGKNEFLGMLYGQMEETQFPYHPLFPSLPFVRHGDPEKVAESTSRQIAACEARIERMKAVIQLKEEVLPKGSLHLLRGILRFSEAERDWLNDVLADAESGALKDVCWTPDRLQELMNPKKTT